MPIARTADTNDAVLSASWRARTMLPTRSRTRKRARVTTCGGSDASLIEGQNSAGWLVTPMANGTSGISRQCAGKTKPGKGFHGGGFGGEGIGGEGVRDPRIGAAPGGPFLSAPGAGG